MTPAFGLTMPSAPPTEPGLRAALAGILPEEAVALTLFVLLGGVVFAQFTLRYGFSHALPWGEEVARMLLIFVVFAGSAAAAARRVHIAVDGSLALFGPRLGRRIAQVALILTALLFAICAGLGAEVARRVWGGSMATLPLSRGWTHAGVAAFLAVAALRTLQVLVRGPRA